VWECRGGRSQIANLKLEMKTVPDEAVRAEAGGEGCADGRIETGNWKQDRSE